MPPVDQPKADALVLLLDEIETLSAQTRQLEMSLKRAHSDALGEVAKFQQQFRAKITSLKAEFEGKGDSASKSAAGVAGDGSSLNIQNADLLRRFAEQQNIIRHGQEESERRGAAIVALREQLERLEAANRELEQNASQRVEHAQQVLKSQVTQLEAELAGKERALEQLQTTLRQGEEGEQATIRRLEQELAGNRESADRRQELFERDEIELNDLRQRIAEFEANREQLQALAQRESESLRQEAQAKIAALQSEVSHKTVLLTQHQSTIARLEQELKASSAASLSNEAEKTLLENYAAEIARRDSAIAELTEAAQQERAKANELARAHEDSAAEIAALRSQLGEKQSLLEERQSVLQNTEQELRNRNRELQGSLAAKEAVIESHEYHLRNAQAQLLNARDALGEKEQALAQWQARVAEQEQQLHAQRQEWQPQLAEARLLVERYRAEMEQTKTELAAATERQVHISEEHSAIQDQARELRVQVEALTRQLSERQADLHRHDEAMRHSAAQAAELRAALDETRDALAQQQASARTVEQELTARLAQLNLELERKEETLRERDAIARRIEPEFKTQIEDLQSQVQEKDRMLEARAREIGILQARVESLSGQATRLEAAQAQALADAAGETDRARQALQAQIDLLQETSVKQQALLHERQAAFDETEEKLRGEIGALSEQAAARQTMLENQAGTLRQAAQESSALRERVAELEAAGRQAEEAAARRAESDTARIAALETQLQSAQQTLAERETALRRLQELQETTAGTAPAHTQGSAEGQSAELKGAQNKIADLLERLAQLEAERHMQQESAAHELQQLRENFETRITSLRMELTTKAPPQTPGQLPADNPSVTSGLAEGVQRQIQELQSQLAEKHALLENRNEELIKAKAELDELRDHFARLNTDTGAESIKEISSVELREEDAVDPPPRFFNGSSRPDPLSVRGAEETPDIATNVALRPGGASNRFTQLEGRLRAWSPKQEKDSAFGTGRRWNMGIFKRRWKS